MSVQVELTERELSAVTTCVSGELDDDDGRGDDYFNSLRRARRKLQEAAKSLRRQREGQRP